MNSDRVRTEWCQSECALESFKTNSNASNKKKTRKTNQEREYVTKHDF
jgi:hypothetical protein